MRPSPAAPGRSRARGPIREKGGRLVRLAFPDTQAQRFGDVVVLYGRYEAVIYSDGAERTLRGRLTEMFVRRDGRWLHPGWQSQFDSQPGAPAVRLHLFASASLARNFAMRSISLTGTGSESGKRIVPLLIVYGTNASLNAATSRSLDG